MMGHCEVVLNQVLPKCVHHWLVIVHSLVLLLLRVEDVAWDLFLILRKALPVLFHEDAEFLLDLLATQLNTIRLVTCLTYPFFLQALGVAERIESVVGRTHSRTNASQHHDLDLLTCHEGVSEYHGQFALTEWDVLALRCLAFLSVKSSNTLLEAEK